ncbi:MAG: hypothetical protein PUD24_07700 [Oscillospiraceae bacterium]|nr:hypothetical protein [Oscillospiraceae bacterium]
MKNKISKFFNWTLAVLYILSCYGTLFVYINAAESVCIGISLLITFIIGAAIILTSFFLYSPDNSVNYKCIMLTVKLALIPAFVINFIFNFILILGSGIVLSFIMGLLGPAFSAFIGIMIFAVTYVVMICPSFYTIAFLRTLHKQKRIPTWQFILHIILQFIFVADVIDALYLGVTFNSKKQPSPAEYINVESKEI